MNEDLDLHAGGDESVLEVSPLPRQSSFPEEFTNINEMLS